MMELCSALKGGDAANRATKIKVVSIVVAYNDVDNVVSCIKKIIENQTQTIVVVDNSEPSKKELLLQMEKMSVSICYIKTKKNYGSAGGFALGMRYAVNELGADLVWLHDQDGFPSPDCLEHLKREFLAERNVGILAPVVRTCGEGDIHKGFRARLNWFGAPVSLSERRLHLNRWRDLDVVGSAGLLISAECIKQVGTYDRSFFFGYEDYEFSQRVKAHGWRIGLSPNADYYHPDLFAKYESHTVTSHFALFDWVKPLYLPVEGRGGQTLVKPLAILLARYGNGVGNITSIAYSALRNLIMPSNSSRYEKMKVFIHGVRAGWSAELCCVDNWSELVEEILHIGNPKS